MWGRRGDEIFLLAGEKGKNIIACPSLFLSIHLSPLICLLLNPLQLSVFTAGQTCHKSVCWSAFSSTDASATVRSRTTPTSILEVIDPPNLNIWQLGLGTVTRDKKNTLKRSLKESEVYYTVYCVGDENFCVKITGFLSLSDTAENTKATASNHHKHHLHTHTHTQPRLVRSLRLLSTHTVGLIQSLPLTLNIPTHSSLPICEPLGSC